MLCEHSKNKCRLLDRNAGSFFKNKGKNYVFFIVVIVNIFAINTFSFSLQWERRKRINLKHKNSQFKDNELYRKKKKMFLLS
jgi:hypothetical protein